MKAWFGLDLWKRVLIGLVLGIALGLSVHYGVGKDAASDFAGAWMKPLGDAFINLIRMLIAPLIFFTLVAGVIAMGDPKRLGSLGGRALGTYFITTWFAVSLGLIVGSILMPGKGVDASVIAGADPSSVQSRLDAGAAAGGVVDRLLKIIPTNPVEALANTDVLGIIFFAIVLGVGILVAKEAGEPVAKVMNSAADVMLKVTEMIMELAPYGVFALVSWVMATQGLGVLDNLARLALSLYVALFLHAVIVYSFIIKGVLRLPLIPFYRGGADAMAVAFSTSSSSATLPVTIACASDNLGVRRSVASSVLPLGATINMDGTAAYLGLVALFAAQALGIEMTFADYAMVALTATLASIGAAGIPSAGLLLAATVLTVIGVSPEQAVLVIALIFPFDRLLDMGRTVLNVTGDLTVATAVAKWEGELDVEVYKARDI